MTALAILVSLNPMFKLLVLGILNSKMNKLDYIPVNKQDLLSHTKSNIQKGLGQIFMILD